MNSLENLGRLLGYPLGLMTGTVAFLRNARTFHPRGIHVRARVHNLDPGFLPLHPYVLIRFTAALWKKRQWPDVLGLSLRFTREEKITEEVRPGDQDLLFASFKHPWQTPAGIFLTRFWDFFSNSYYAVSPFEVEGRKVIFKVTPERRRSFHGNRVQTLAENLSAHANLILWWKEGDSPWHPLAQLKLEEALQLDEARLYFNPFRSGLGIRPRGFVHHLRIGAYRLGQWGRDFRRALSFSRELQRLDEEYTQSEQSW